MKIKEIRAYKMDLGLTKPYTVTYQTFSDAVNAFLEIELENGIIGMGAAAEGVFVTGEAMKETMANLYSDNVQKWVGKDIRYFRSIIADSNIYFQQYPATRAAIDIALHDAFCKYLNIPVVDFYGRKHDLLPTSVTIGIGDVKSMLEAAGEYKLMGFKVLKIKTGLECGPRY